MNFRARRKVSGAEKKGCVPGNRDEGAPRFFFAGHSFPEAGALPRGHVIVAGAFKRGDSVPARAGTHPDRIDLHNPGVAKGLRQAGGE
jgi:hypothetical protein